ncbi:hypothetical protein HY524_02415 [Candidatus Berkelbacteria bacterium]|nr:hypothetical protein [Candidatus Berkelbacteria bacterium]
MSRRRRPTSTLTQTPARLPTVESNLLVIDPKLLRSDLIRVAGLYLCLLIILSAIALWQRHSPTPTALAERLQHFLNF